MPRFSERMLQLLTRKVHSVYPGIPVINRWPDSATAARRLLAPVRYPVRWRLASWYRPRLQQTSFIGLTGSAGKTMAKAMMGAVLSTRYQGVASRGSANLEHDIAKNVLETRAADGYCVVELSADGGPGSLCRTLELLQPAIGVVTNIGTDHLAAYGTPDAIAEEKGRLIRALPENGIAVLNADDARVMAMSAGIGARVVSFGLSEGADVRAESVSATWPDRLSFDLVYGGDRAAVRTQLCGTQWVSSALAAAAVGLVMDVPLADIVRALESVEPFVGRMSPLTLPDGVTFIRDDWKASLHTIPAALAFLEHANAARKIAVIGTISDYSGTSRTHYRRTASRALEVADVVVFVGPRASMALRARPPGEPERLQAFPTIRTAADFLGTFLKAGDLVLLKGSNGADHLYRIALSRMSPVGCWRADCRKSIFCNSCALVGKGQPLIPGEAATVQPERARLPADGTLIRNLARARNVLIGLGNPGDKYRNTPHNVGYAVVDRIATEAEADWSDVSDVLVAQADWHGAPVTLIKPKVAINFSGRALHAVFAPLAIGPDRVVLVFDDISMSLGKVRFKMHGSDGGHLGVRSILEAFQSDAFRRIKIGVQRSAEGEEARDSVLAPFSGGEEQQMATAVDQAVSKLRELFVAAT